MFDLKKKVFIITFVLLVLVAAIVFVTYFLIPPGTQDEFLRKNDAILGQYSTLYNFQGNFHKVFAVYKSRFFENINTGQPCNNGIIVYMANSENEDFEILQSIYENNPEKIYALDKKNHRINGQVYVSIYGDYCKNIVLVCGEKVDFEELKYLILLGTEDGDGNPQKLMFPLVDARENPIPEPKYKPVIEAYKNGPEITLSEYDQIQEGMDYITVVGIVGSEGTLLSSTEIAGTYSKLYCWYGEDGISNATIMFTNGSVSLKSEFLLK